LALAGPVMPSRSAEPLLSEWEALIHGFDVNRRWRITPLLRWLSKRGNEPGDVQLSDLFEYRDAILTDRLRGKPESTWDSLVWTWNLCMREVPGWPQVEIERVSRRETYALPWSAFPKTFEQDVDRFLDRLSGRDLSEDGPARPARPVTLETRARQLRLAASALVLRGQAPETITCIADMLTLDHYKDILRFFIDRNGEASTQVAQIAAFLKDTARHWVKVDEATLQAMKKLASRVAIPRRGMTQKNRERLRPLDDHKNVEAFLGLPARIRGKLVKETGSPIHKAVLAQTAAAIALLQAAPIRLKNLVNLDVRKNLIARGKRLYLVIPPEDVKNGEPIDFELPSQSVDMLIWYVREYRPQLLREPNDALFPGEGAGPKSSSCLSMQISKTVQRYTGMKFNVHLFRHAGGKLFLDARPGQYEVVRRVLGHRSIATTTAIYTGAETRSAGAHFAAVIAERRRATEPCKAPSKPKKLSARDKTVKGAGGRS
jgi:integrase